MSKPWLDDGDLALYHGDAITVLQSLPSGIAQTCVTSPPYWGLRDYGTGTWTGGDETGVCEHRGSERYYTEKTAATSSAGAFSEAGDANAERLKQGRWREKGSCIYCGAQRVDSQLGLEATPDQYVERLVAVFREVRRVLRDDGTLWINLGDSYAQSAGRKDADDGRAAEFRQRGEERGYAAGSNFANYGARMGEARSTVVGGLKPKDLVGIPWRVAFALQADGWYLRSDIIWSKPNPMPESVTDRPTKSHEYLFLFSKQPRYFYDADAIREPAEYGYSETRRVANSNEKWKASVGDVSAAPTRQSNTVVPGDGTGGRNRRSVWVIPTEPFPEAHFATYPQALVRPCILAGTSERGGCVECGAPWVRKIEATGGTIGNGWHDHAKDAVAGQRSPNTLRNSQDGSYQRREVGWRPSCSCDVGRQGPPPGRRLGDADREPAPIPQLVLDPFLGSGTTALVARKHGRRCIGIDLSSEYLAIAARRTQQLSLLGGAA